MAEQSKQGEQFAEEREQKRRFNRQVNYFVMRYMWQVICGQNSDDTIYLTFDTSRERYTRVVNTGIIRYKKNELDHLQEITGLRRALFTGEARFDCFHEEERRKEKQTDREGETDSENIVKKHITEKEWKEMFQWREKQRGQGGRGKRSIKGSPEEKVCILIKKTDYNDIENEDFYNLCFFLRMREPVPVKVPEATMREIATAINKLSFPLLDRCQVGQLQHLQKLLKAKQSLISGIIIYKNAKNDSRKKK